MEKNLHLTVVIPAKDEFTKLEILLNQLRQQTHKDFDIIVADNSDHGTTRYVCSKAEVRCIRGGLPGAGRNRGTEAAGGEYILFLDADMHLDARFVERAMRTLALKKADCVSFGFYHQGNKRLERLHQLMTYYFFLMTKLGFPHAIGGAILVKKSVHEAIGGFDETITVLEDFNYVKRISKKYRYRFVLKPSIGVSIRRIKKEGLRNLVWKYVRMEFHRLFFGEIRTNKYKYFD